MTATVTSNRPQSLTALSAIYRAFLRGQLSRVRALGLLGLGAVAVLLAIISRGADDPNDAGAQIIAEYGVGVVVPVCTLWVASALMGELIEDRLLVYLWLKPVSRWIIPTAAVAAVLTIMFPLVVAPVAIAALVADTNDLLLATVGATILGVTAYAGLFVWLGARFNRALWWGLVYILIWENALARISDGTARLSIRSYAVSTIKRATSVDIKLADRATWSSITIPLLIALAGIGLATRAMTRRDVD